MKSSLRIMAVVLALSPVAARQGLGADTKAVEPPAVTVFDFQMRTGAKEWRWLEKASADLLITELFQSQQVDVIQRDKMQELALRLQWAPEMATSPKGLDMLTESVKLRYLVSGVFDVRGDTISNLVTIVDLSSRKVVAVRSAEGKATQLGQIVRSLAKGVLQACNGRSSDQALDALPVWSQSITAAQTLYTGIDCMDRGDYDGALRQFRRASREDAEYAEVRYWVGSVLYQRNRYDHAKVELEAFIRDHPSHPRTGAAVFEYITICENDATAPEALRAFYEEMLLKKWMLHGWIPGDWYEPIGSTMSPMEAWLRWKLAILNHSLGRYMDACQVIKGNLAIGVYGRQFPHRVFLEHHKTTGRTLDEKTIQNTIHAGGSLAVYDDAKKDWRIVKDPSTTVHEQFLFIMAPEGKRFRRLQVFPVGVNRNYGNNVQWPYDKNEVVPVVLGLGHPVHKVAGWDLPYAFITNALAECVQRKPVRELERDGILFDPPPLGGLTSVDLNIRNVIGFEIEAEFEPMGEVGSIHASCRGTTSFRVDVDGRFGSLGDGFIGPLTPGEHTLTFHPPGRREPALVWTTNVFVRAGETTRVVGRVLNPRPGGKSSPEIAVAGLNYPEMFRITAWEGKGDVPQIGIQADNDAIRLVWSECGDLWVGISRDGRNFAPPVKLPAPVSTAWQERDPKLMCDSSGRFVLTFWSDRNGPHELWPYVAWSRDLRRWSTPVAMAQMPVLGHDVIIDSEDQLVRAERVYVVPDASSSSPERILRKAIRLYKSEDGNVWKPFDPATKTTKLLADFAVAETEAAAKRTRAADEQGNPKMPSLDLSHVRGGIYLRGPYRDMLRLRELEGGGYELFIGGEETVRVVSKDGVEWLAPQTILRSYGDRENGSDHYKRFAVVNGKMVLWSLWEDGRLLMRDDDGEWRENGYFRDLFDGVPSMEYHPRWGYLFAWQCPRRDPLVLEHRAGPFMAVLPHGLLVDSGKR